jgi:hypothetical protein
VTQVEVEMCGNLDLTKNILERGYVPGNRSLTIAFGISLLELFRFLFLYGQISHLAFVQGLSG